MAQQRALFMTNTKTFYAAPTGLYLYWFTPAQNGRDSVLKIQCSRATMAAFRKTADGRAQDRFADVFEIGGGWYEVTSKDMTEWDAWFGSKTDGAKLWLKSFNLAHLATVDANPKFVIERVRRVDPNKVLTQRPVWMPTPEEVRNRERLDSKLQTLAGKFNSARR